MANDARIECRSLPCPPSPRVSGQSDRDLAAQKSGVMGIFLPPLCSITSNSLEDQLLESLLEDQPVGFGSVDRRRGEGVGKHQTLMERNWEVNKIARVTAQFPFWEGLLHHHTFFCMIPS